MELTHSEGGTEECAGKGGTAGDCFLLVEGCAESFSTEGSLYACTDSRDTGCATDKLNSVDLVEGETRVCESLLERGCDAIEERVNELFVGITGKLG